MSSTTFTNKVTGRSVTFTPKASQGIPVGGWPIKQMAKAAKKKKKSKKK